MQSSREHPKFGCMETQARAGLSRPIESGNHRALDRLIEAPLHIRKSVHWNHGIEVNVRVFGDVPRKKFHHLLPIGWLVASYRSNRLTSINGIRPTVCSTIRRQINNGDARAGARIARLIGTKSICWAGQEQLRSRGVLNIPDDESRMGIQHRNIA